MYSALDVARYVVNYSNKKKYGISNLKLQKILYFIQAYFMIQGKKDGCFYDTIEAWDFGPVVPVVYREYKRYGSCNIPTIETYYDFDDVWELKENVFNEEIISKEDRKLIETVVDRFSNFSATDLVTLTHKQAPWEQAYVPYQNNIITNDEIRGFFCE